MSDIELLSRYVVLYYVTPWSLFSIAIHQVVKRSNYYSTTLGIIVQPHVSIELVNVRLPPRPQLICSHILPGLAPEVRRLILPRDTKLWHGNILSRHRGRQRHLRRDTPPSWRQVRRHSLVDVVSDACRTFSLLHGPTTSDEGWSLDGPGAKIGRKCAEARSAGAVELAHVGMRCFDAIVRNTR